MLVAYSNSFTAGFALDNKQLILNDPRIRAATAENAGLIIGHSYWWPYGESGLYRPLTTFSYLFNYAVLGNGARPAGYHWINLGLHATNVLLVYALMRRLNAEQSVSMAGAAVWAVMPTSTEAVTNIVGRADLLAAASVLAGTIFYTKSRATPGRARVGWLIALAVTTLAGVFAKESAVSIVLVILAYEVVWWNRPVSVRALAAAALALAPPLLLLWWQRSAVLAAAAVAEFPFEDNPIVEASFWIGRLTAITVIARYLSLAVWPARLSVDYSFGQIPLARGSADDWIAVAIVTVLAAVVFVFREQQKTLFFWVAFGLATFLPVSNLVFPTGTIMAERLMYLPSAGLAAAFAIALDAIARTRTHHRAAATVITLVVIAFAARTWLRNKDWKDDVTLWSAAVVASPASAKAHRALAEALYEPTFANLDRVIAEAETSVALLEPLPDELSSFKSYRQAAAYHLDKASLLARATSGAAASEETRREYDRAGTLLRKSIAIIKASVAHSGGDSRPSEADARSLLAAAHLGRSDARLAIDEASQAQQLDPTNLRAHQLGASAFLALQQPEDAAVALMVGSLLTSDPALRRDLIGLYRSGLDQEGCAVRDAPSGPILNPACPMVRRHLCAASPKAIAFNLQLGRSDEAERLTRAATTDLGCSSATPMH